ncbi:MAG TPA: hypothetical protein VIK95_07250, partial [Egibacteraceae bacterium]
MDAGHPVRLGVARAAPSAAPHQVVALARLADRLGADLVSVEPGDDRLDVTRPPDSRSRLAAARASTAGDPSGTTPPTSSTRDVTAATQLS